MVIQPKVEIRWCGEWCTISADNFGAMEHLTLSRYIMAEALEALDKAGGEEDLTKRDARIECARYQGAPDVIVITQTRFAHCIRLTLQQIRNLREILLGEIPKHWPDFF